MASFVYPALLWGLALAGIPVLIHLINMMRHRRVPWAAMEFLLVSQKKNRTWILLKQLLLLMARMTAVAIIVLLVAQPVLRNQLGRWIGGSKTHHIVLLDDSYSMSDRRADSSAMDEGKLVIFKIGEEAARQLQPQTFTLLRFSQVGRPSVGAQPDFLEEPVDNDFLPRLRQVLDSLEVSQTAAGPIPAMEAVVQLLGDSDDENRVVYLVTDFRARQWDDATEVKNQLAKLETGGARLHLINCVDAARANLAIVSLKAGPGTRAASVPLFMEVTVQNFGTTAVRDVPVFLETDGLVRPAVNVAQIPPGKAVTERFPIQFTTAGRHRIAARLESDSVEADNFRFAALDFPLGVPVLLVDGDPAATDAGYVRAALDPGGPVATGIRPRIENPRYLSLNPLESFRAIYVMNVERLDPSGVEALQRYASDGGGVAFFLGERSSPQFINDQLWREGKGLFPLPVESPAQLKVDRLQKAPDLEVGRHPVFQVFTGERNSFLSMVNIDRYFSVPKDWQAGRQSSVQVIGRLRNGAPLVVERKFARGRVVAFLTTAAPTWNNWARNNPSFVVAMLELQSFLAGQAGQDDSRLVGSPLELKLDASAYEKQVRWLSPDPAALPAVSADAVASPDGSLALALSGTDRSGIYTAELTRKDGTSEDRLFAFNVDPAEGDLRTLGSSEIAARLDGIDYEYEQAAGFHAALEELAGYDLAEPLLYLLVVLLIGEQILAWSASYHPPARHRLARGAAP
ncbi:MAG: BatA domain-containing protein [Pirellulales bacterium]|nr:BatA domain-containing protein [Pirellulales bacterium]